MGTLARALLICTAVTVLTAPAAMAAPAPQVDTVSAADQQAALAYWTPERMRQVGADSNVPGEQIAKPVAVPKGVGRFFFTEVPGQDSWCTATAVPSSNRDTLITAAHCVHPGFTRNDVEIKVTNVVFVPGYDRGQAPHGVFAARAFLAPEEHGLTPNDVAMVVLNTRQGKHIADVAGTQKIAFGTRPAGNASILGYPGSTLAYGEFLMRCDVPVTFTQSSIGDYWNSPCDMAGGSSGGPWIAGGAIIAVTSRGGMDEDLHTTSLEGPTMGSVAKDVYQRASGM